MEKRLVGKVVLITGSTSGIGRATARLFAAHGATVITTGRRAEWGASLVDAIRTEGGAAYYRQADLLQAGAVQGVVRYALEVGGRLDILMNNATYQARGAGGTALTLQEEGFDGQIMMNLKVPLLACKEALPAMIQQGGGVIINVSSMRAFIVGNGSLAYDTAKAGMINLTRSIALDFGQYGIRCNAICPGMISNEGRAARMGNDPQKVREWEEREGLIYPIGRVGQPIDVAKVALFLASDDSAFVTGTSIAVDGGMSCRLPETLYPVFERYYRETLAKEWKIEPPRPTQG